eukprot:CAMPEP_0181290618 /NCGR_PEP_ID=MMETSP1101-20121128/1508_1 /TAXON_ID=46948 /ORGANISM="Rhodomonas abbreviata, Strain Caron Lab Isolate" /LENGTH=327 /DNA_ID=CAMNT_0023394911 /DNA_START=280 /DNA_END=1260 /DNA_ORIENTATION=-
MDPNALESAAEEAGTAPLHELNQRETPFVTRRYHVWPGNNSFFCSGRIMMGPGPASCLVTLAIILVPSGTFFLSTVACLAQHGCNAGAIAGVTAAIVLWILYTFFRTAVCDPGVIPRRAGYADPNVKLPASQGVVMNGRVVTLKYCVTCNIYRPPRCSHCKVCDNCVDRFDHHCPWVGNCIGRRNYFWFLQFTFSSALFAIYISLFALYAMLLEGGMWPPAPAPPVSWSDALVAGARALPATVSVLLICLLSLLFTGTLSVFHACLASVNMTTAEKMKGLGAAGPWAYTRGCSQNWRALLCDPTPPSLVEPLEEVQIVPPSPSGRAR